MLLFHERIKELRDASEKTQVQIAEALNITPQALSYYINGREPSYDTLIKMADFFNVSIDYLLGRSDFKNFQQELDYQGRIDNAQSSNTIPGAKQIISINENFSAILNELIIYNEDYLSNPTLDALNRLLIMILHIKDTLRGSFSDMERYIDFLKILRHAETPSSLSSIFSLGDIEIRQPQVDACKKYLNEFIFLYISIIFDFEKMKLKEGK